MPNPRVHFENQSSDSTEHIVEEQQSEGEDDNKRLDWNQRHSILSRLSPLIMNNRHSTEELENRYSRMVEGTGDGMLSSELGYLIEYADLRLADAKHSDNNNQRAHGKGGQNKHPKPLSKVEIKLLNRVVDDCRFDRSDDFVVVKTISRSETGKVELVRSKLSSIESTSLLNLNYRYS
ncbi:hypothetical protein BY996DRAFT_3166650 [Phakopsora pachyrhizi]|nr:hypothetical protein BY996DRAFT_3166650 [Phakopsora pachyrhizi]